MLAELAIDDLVLIARARLELSPGLNVISGETGAGKTLLAQAIGLLLGQKGGEDLIRPGADRALVQALFERDDETLAVARELPRGGRSRALMNGLLSSASAVEETLRERLAFYGQLEHTRLLQLERQLDLLDGFAAAEIGPLAEAYVAAYRGAQDLVRALDALRGAGQEREREIDMLRFQVDEIEQAAVEPGEDERLAHERERARHAGKLLERTGGALALLSGEGEHAALDALRVAQRLVGEAATTDAGLETLAGRLDGLAAETDDVAAALRAYVDDLDVDPATRDALELRYDKLKALMRKYGATADEVIAYAASGKERLALLETSEADEEQLAAQAAAARDAALAAAAVLGEARRRVAPEFAARVAAELQDLAMPHATFEVRLAPRNEAADTPDERFAALGPRGADEVEFYFGANPGVPARPLRETASGGELSRAMLAIRGMVTLGDDVETLIFDEVDAGIGGVTAAALGERLARLASQRQIVCITHLPQVAAHAERQFAIVKEADAAAGVTETVVTQVEGEERLAELCRMLGAAPDDAAAREHAQGLLARAAR
jgi:DNA repair protein RecN (Recombination protein N)